MTDNRLYGLKIKFSFICAYLNAQGSSPSETPLKRIDNG
ncbi:hypothetical protein T09_11285 [Trichinella sp. T9]|nr:hypothetical protein T09_11285 [Trichinella sp. T9]